MGYALMKGILVLIGLTCFCLLSSFIWRKEHDYGGMAYSIMNSYSDHLAKTKKIYLEGSGGAMNCDLKELKLRYVSDLKLDLTQARKLYIELVEGLLKLVNNNKEIRQYLHNYPFTKDNIDIIIGFEDKNGKSAKNPKIACIWLAKGKICYSVCKGNSEKFENLCKEPYDDALRIVKEENAKTLLISK